VGIGLVGSALAENLLAAGYSVAGYDTSAERLRHLQSLGGRAVQSARDVAEHARRVILSLPDTDVVLEAVEGPSGLMQAQELPTDILDTTTGDPDRTAALARRLAARGVAFLDATLSGSSEQVRRREAVFMVGGRPEAYEQCRDLFETLAEVSFPLGPPGSGSRAKLASNLILGLNRLVLAEGLLFAQKLGLDPAAFLEMVKTTPAYSRAMDVKGEKMIRGDFTPQSRIVQHLKDLQIILDYAGREGQELPLARVHRDILQEAVAAGEGNLDTSAVIQVLARHRADAQGRQS
jgi:3-hydroxyisobutyrate dehydrogenase-like beta-hydroxyacid dehydrogenase